MADFLVIRGADLLDVDAGEVLEGRQLLIANGAVEAVLREGEATPDGARVLDLAGLTILPGLIDCHSHLIGDMEFAGVPATTTSAAEEAMTGVRNAKATIEAGFTTVRDVGTYRAFVDVALRNAIDAGWLAGPRMQCAGAYITSPGGGGEVTGLALDVTLPADLRFGVVRSPAEARQKVRELVGGGADLIKLIVTGAVLTRGTRPDVVELDEATVRAAVEEAAAHGVFVAAHAHGTEGIKVAIRAGVRSIEHGSLIDDEGIALLAAQRHVPGSRTSTTATGSRRSGRATGGRPRRSRRTGRRPMPSGRGSGRPSRQGSAWPTGRIAGCTRTGSTPGSCPISSGTG